MFKGALTWLSFVFFIKKLLKPIFLTAAEIFGHSLQQVSGHLKPMKN